MKNFFTKSFRMKLVGVYSLIIIISLVTFSNWFYSDTKKWFYGSIDKSIVHLANSIDDFFIKTTSENNIDSFDDVYSDSLNAELKESLKLLIKIYESMMFNPQKYYIQIMGNDHQLLWKSKNLSNTYLPTFPNEEEIKDLRTYAESIYAYDTVPRYIFRRELKGQSGDTVYSSIPFHNNDMRLFIKRTDDYVISIGYSLVSIQYIMERFASYFIYGVPVIILFLVSILIFMSKLGFAPIKQLTENLKSIKQGKLEDDLVVFEINGELTELSESIRSIIDYLKNKIEKNKNFAYDASHELKTPLTILRGELEMALNKSNSTEDFETVISSSLDEVIRLTNVVETLLELSRADNGKVQMNFAPTNVSKMLEELIDDIEIIAEEKNITLESNISKDIIFSLDKNRIYQALLNILDNAVKYTPNSGNIFVTMQKESDCLSITVKDNGIGMNEESLNNIFERFYRAKSEHLGKIPGTGLGLSIVKWIIDSHNGEIIVISRQSEGCTFTVSLPENYNE